ncbi:MAG: cobalamin-dependent protein [Gemmatimonadaceae bacterium]|nr:cobalamin-dependent protein [Gemmatimonadaceae bacterium]
MSLSPREVEPRHPVRIVVQRTGLSADLLRAWEKRYQVVKPHRSPGGQRYYSDIDVNRLRLLQRAVRAGRAISRIAGLSIDELERLVREDDEQGIQREATPATDVAAGAPELFLSNALIATEQLDARALENTLRQAAMRLSADHLLDEVISPLLFTIGSLWHAGRLRPTNEHLATQVIRRVLGWITEVGTSDPRAPAILVATPSGQNHELGAMLVAATASQYGWRVLYLGANLPSDDIAAAAVQARADVVALSIVFPTDDSALPGELLRLKKALPPGVAITVGGSGASSYKSAFEAVGAQYLPGLGQLRRWLRNSHPTPV